MPATHKAKIAMTKAWEIARRGQALYGGPVRTFFREALRLAWVEVKANPVLREADKMIAEARARRAAKTKPATPPLSPGLMAAAGRARRRYGTRNYGNGAGAAYYTAAW